jgi:trans-aconitate 2-methyltransferase
MSAPIAEDVFVHYLANVVLVAQLEAVPATERAHLAAAVAERMARPAVDYVRLEVTAGRAV